MNRYFFVVLAVIASGACKSEAASKEVLAATASSPTDNVICALICKDITQPEDKIKHHDVYAVVDNDTVKVGTIEDCKKIDPTDYAKYEIPEDACEAVGATGADKITYVVYLGKSPEGKITGRIGHNYPGKASGSFDYRSMVVFDEADIAPGVETSPGAMVGSYVHSGSASSHVLYLGYNNRTLMGQLFTLKGPLPENPDSIMIALSKATPEMMSNIQVNFDDLSFSSLKGPGKFQGSGNRITGITFSKADNGKELSLVKKDIGKAQ